MADLFNSIIGFNTNAKDLISESEYNKDEDDYNASFEFNESEGETSDTFSINDVDEYEFDYTAGTKEPEEPSAQENPFL